MIQIRTLLSRLPIVNFLFSRIGGWLFYGIYNSVIAQDPRLFFNCIMKCRLPRSTIITHATGIVIGGGVELGDDVIIFQNTTLGGKGWDYETKFPSIGDNVIIYSGAAVLGDVNVGDNAVIAANAVVLDDVPPGTVVAGAPAEVVGTHE